MKAGAELEYAINGDAPYPGERADGKRWYSLNVHWWDSGVVFGATKRKPGGSADVWGAGNDFAEAVAHATRYIEGQGHHVDQVTVNV